MRAADVPLVPGTEGGATLAEVRVAAEELGFPVLLKATAGGGGKGMRLVRGPDELEAAYSTARVEAEAAFSDGSLYLEKALVPGAARRDPGALRQGRRRPDARRARVLDPAAPPEADRGVAVARARRGDARGDGGGRRAGVPDDRLRERRHVRVPARRRRHVPLHRAERAAPGRAPGQRARDRHRRRARAAAGRRRGSRSSLTGRAPRRGHALEIRLNAEDPARDFAPAPGTITRFRPPLGPGVRIDTHLEEGSAISPYYDSLIAKLIVWAEDRPAAIARGIRALEEIELDGVPTTRGLALDILRSAEFAGGEYSTSFLGEMEGRLPALAAG